MSELRDYLPHIQALEQNRQLEAALKALEAVLVTFPNDIQLITWSARLLKRSGRFQEAAIRYREALKLKPQLPELWFNLGNALQAQGRAEEAERAYMRAIRLKPALTAAHYNLGHLLRDRGRLETSAIAFEQVV